jgi:hypothetical protein
LLQRSSVLRLSPMLRILFESRRSIYPTFFITWFVFEFLFVVMLLLMHSHSCFYLWGLFDSRLHSRGYGSTQTPVLPFMSMLQPNTSFLFAACVFSTIWHDQSSPLLSSASHGYDCRYSKFLPHFCFVLIIFFFL